MKPSLKSEVLKLPSSVFGVSKEEFKIYQKLEQSSYKISDITLEVGNGIQPTGDKIFRVDYKFAKENHFEKELLKKVIVGGDFNRYELVDPGKHVIYTNKDININDFPKIEAYLERYKEQLSKKRETKKGILPWWCLHWPRYKKLFEEPKIVIRQTSDKIIATFDEEGFYAMNNVIILKLIPELDLDYKFVLACLNSKLINFIYKKITQEDKRTFAEVKPKNVKKLFLPKIPGPEQLPFITRANKMLELKKQYNEMISKFTRYISNAYNLKKISNRLENFHCLTFKEFINELKYQKAAIAKKDEFEFMELFEEQKGKVTVLKNKIEKTDREINQMVYSIYGLTEEEIHIIEN